MTMLISFVILVVSIVIHEIAHGLVAYWLGDPTAKRMGRLSLNPIAHVDMIGTILVPSLSFFFGGTIFGWAKPVPINPSYFKSPEKGMLYVAVAGPLSNLFLIFLASAGLFFVSDSQSSIFSSILMYSIYINGVLILFNLLPIPPLDGSRVLAFFVNQTFRSWLYRLEPYGFIVIFVLLYIGFISYYLNSVLPMFVKFFIPRVFL
jgi:Zn-dependent protease